MKALFWVLTLVAFGLLGLTISETQQLRSAQAQLDRNALVNAQVHAALFKAQREQTATALAAPRHP
ncbi:MAG: hypothetical protein HYR88_01050 [Verrucomicrobia bacterium]|nr:hypothetical protein [Verrucomicrobiota bacterium]MBI3868845.1 hypothetical protein [Verrucomicrobiota bacterium]